MIHGPHADPTTPGAYPPPTRLPRLPLCQTINHPHLPFSGAARPAGLKMTFARGPPHSRGLRLQFLLFDSRHFPSPAPSIAGSLRAGRWLASSLAEARRARRLGGISGPPGAGVSAGMGLPRRLDRSQEDAKQRAYSVEPDQKSVIKVRSHWRMAELPEPTASTERNHLTCAPMAE
jgi:hypothetical protein